MLTSLLNFIISQMYSEKQMEVDKLLSKIKFGKIKISLPEKVSKHHIGSSSPKYRDYVVGVAENVDKSIDILSKANQQCKDAIQQLETQSFVFPIKKPMETFLNDFAFFKKWYQLSLNHYQLLLDEFNTAVNNKKNNAKIQYTKQIDEIEQQLKELQAIAVLPFSKTFSNDLLPIVLPPKLREYEISMLQHFDVITALPALTKFHDCIDIDTYSLKFKNAHYYFYRNVLVVDKPSGICMIDYDDIKTTKGMREISRSSDHFSWSGWYLEITSKFGFKVDFACKEEGVFEWLNTCFSLSIKDKSYTHEDVIREITAELERRNAEIEKRNAEIEAEKADRRNRPDYYAALDWVEEKQKILSTSRRAVSSQTDQVKRMQAKAKLYNTLNKLIEQTGKKQLKATGAARAVYDAFAAKLEDLCKLEGLL